jgi:Putative Actinobacterial Holin-X, holin superfamily III
VTVTPQPNAGPRPGATATSAASPATVEPSMGELVSEASQHLSTLVRSEIELAKLELRSTVKNAGVGAGAFIGALVVLVFSLTFGFLALAEGIAALGLDRWLAFLIVFAFQLLVVGVLVFLGIRKIKRVKAPERTISTSKETVAYLRSHA